MPTLTRTSKSTPETLTRRTVDGTIYVLSSDGHTEYRVTVSPLSCAGKGFTFRGQCCHATAAQARYSEPQPDAQPCHACGVMTTGIDSRRVSAGRYVDIPLCRLGEGHCA
jgi:hypothetical protein